MSDIVYNGPAGMMHAMEKEARRGGFFAISASVDPLDNDSISQGIEHLRRLGIEGLVIERAVCFLAGCDAEIGVHVAV